jgi:manganese/zinc/iron transport system permease protein
MIVLVATALFLVSMTFGTARGLLLRFGNQRAFEAKVRRQHLLRAVFECIDGHDLQGDPRTQLPKLRVPVSRLLEMRSWSLGTLRAEISRAERAGQLLSTYATPREVVLTLDGWHAAAEIVRQHRLWEMYLITHADIAPSHVDRDADAIEHVLGPEMVRELEELLAVEKSPLPVVPRSPHTLVSPPTP